MKYLFVFATLFAASLLFVEPAYAADFTPFVDEMELGARGVEVRKLQTFLAADADMYRSGVISGYYGARTKAAVRKFQAIHNLPQTGNVGPLTLIELNKRGSLGLTVSTRISSESSTSFPTRLKIPSIQLDVSIERLGLTSAGAMAAPKGTQNVSWFKLGPRPGQEGSAVIGGHSGWWKNGKPAVFDGLKKLQKGDVLSVEDDTGASLSFVVRESRLYDADTVVPEVFTSNEGIHLNLVTCAGVWDESKNSYPKRLVVFTDVVGLKNELLATR